jgi:starvation-inducible DNA-binding protein
MTKKKSSKKKAASSLHIGISQKALEKSCKVLSEILADQHVLYIKKRNFHWNLIGERFHTLHVFYEEQYTALEQSIDQTAERIRQLGGTSPGSMAEFLKLATLKENSGKLIHGEDSLNELVSDHESVIRALRKAIDAVSEDEGTADFLTGMLQAHEQMAWMLRSFLR